MLAIIMNLLKNDNIPLSNIDFDDIYYKYVQLVLHIAKNILYDDDSAKDAAQETFIRVFKSLGNFNCKDQQKLKTWICVIARNVSIDMYRKRKREDENIDYWDNDLIAETIESKDYEHLEMLTIKELTNEVYDIIKSMDIKYRDIIILKCYLEFSNDQIAKMLDMTANNVGVRLYRARKMVLEELKYRNTLEVMTDAAN